MAYKGFVGSGTIGHFQSTTALQNLYPADMYAGRMATVEVVAGSATHYYSNGISWQPNAMLVTDSSGKTVGIAGGDGKRLEKLDYIYLPTYQQSVDAYTVGATPANYEIDFTKLDSLPSGVTSAGVNLSSKGAYVSKASEVVSIALATVLPSLTASAWTVEVDVELDPAVAITADRTVFEFGGTTNNRMVFALSQTGLGNTTAWANLSTVPGLDIKSGSAPTNSVPNKFKVMLASSGTGFNSTINNTMLSTITSLQTVSGTLNLNLGATASLGNAFLNGWIRSIRIWQSTLSVNRLYANAPYSSYDVVCWGDSLTQGSGASPPSLNFPVVLSKKLGRLVLNKGIPGDTSTQIRTRFFSDTDRTRDLTHIIWAGRNSPTPAATVLADIAAIVSRLGHSRFVVLSVINKSDGTENAGSAAYINIMTLNAQLAAAYPANYIDIRSQIVAASGGANDAPAPSATADGLHLTATWYDFVATKVNNFITAAGW